jgi:hypothetical protein
MGKAGENPALTRNRKSAQAESRNAHFKQLTPNNHRRGLRVESEELISDSQPAFRQLGFRLTRASRLRTQIA